MIHPEDFQYRRSGEYFALAAGAMEELAAEELTELGATNVVPAYRGVHFSATNRVLYAINYRARLISRVLAPLLTFDCHSDRYLYRTAGEIDWSALFGLGDTFAVFATVSNSAITHSQFAARRLKDAIVDQFRDRTGDRPSVRTPDPDVWLNLHIHANRAVISVDTSGGSLHRRGYRTASVEAPMQETLAAAIIRLTGWKGDVPLIDPMCGSGTLLAEAHMLAANIPAGFGRERFGFHWLPDFEADTWVEVRTEANEAVRTVPDGIISGSDRNIVAVRASRENLRNLPGGDAIQIRKEKFQDHAEFHDGVIVSNPPYGLRLGLETETPAIWRDLGDWMKQRCSGSTAYLYAGQPELLKSVGLRPAFRRPLTNGALDGRLARYDLY